VRGATGGSIAAPVWARVMRHLDPGGSWAPPPGVERRQVDEYGNIVASNCPVIGQVREEWFIEGSAPLGRCQLPSDAMWDSIYGYTYAPYDTLGGMDDSWLQRLRRRLFGREGGDTLSPGDEPGRIRPGRPEDTVPMYDVPDVPDPSRRTPPGRDRRQPSNDRPMGEPLDEAPPETPPAGEVPNEPSDDDD
jgi:hypothetical protein